MSEGIVIAILSVLSTALGAGWISTYIEKKSIRKQLDAEGDQARIGNLQSVCDMQETEIVRLRSRLDNADERYAKLETQYYEVLERQQKLIERVSTLEAKLSAYESNT